MIHSRPDMANTKSTTIVLGEAASWTNVTCLPPVWLERYTGHPAPVHTDLTRAHSEVLEGILALAQAFDYDRRHYTLLRVCPKPSGAEDAECIASSLRWDLSLIRQTLRHE